MAETQDTWRESLEAGYELIDRQHRELIRLIEELMALECATEREMLTAVDALVVGSIGHFFVEEAVMAQVGYPVWSAQRMIAQHRLFESAVDVQLARYRDGALRTLVPLREYITEFLTNHEFVTDGLLADWIRGRLAALAAGADLASGCLQVE